MRWPPSSFMLCTPFFLPALAFFFLKFLLQLRCYVLWNAPCLFWRHLHDVLGILRHGATSLFPFFFFLRTTRPPVSSLSSLKRSTHCSRALSCSLITSHFFFLHFSTLIQSPANINVHYTMRLATKEHQYHLSLRWVTTTLIISVTTTTKKEKAARTYPYHASFTRVHFALWQRLLHRRAFRERASVSARRAV